MNHDNKVVDYEALIKNEESENSESDGSLRLPTEADGVIDYTAIINWWAGCVKNMTSREI